MTKILLALALLLLGLVLPISAQERIDFTVPVVTTNTGYTLDGFNSSWGSGTLTITLKDSTGKPLTCVYNQSTNPTGAFLNLNLQKANLSSAYNNNATTGSLTQRVYHRFVVMGESLMACGVVITGTITGSVP